MWKVLLISGSVSDVQCGVHEFKMLQILNDNHVLFSVFVYVKSLFSATLKAPYAAYWKIFPYFWLNDVVKVKMLLFEHISFCVWFTVYLVFWTLIFKQKLYFVKDKQIF